MRFRLPHFIIPRGNRLEGERIYLRPPRYRDWRAWAALRESSREFLVPWEPSWPPDCLSRAAYRRRMRQAAAEWHEDSAYAFLIFRHADDALIGGVNLSNVRRGVAQAASLGYWIGASFARQGFMTEALACLMPFLFDRLGLHRVEAACLPHNAASRALLRKVGFREEGFARGYLRINGAWQDHVLHALLRADLAGARRVAGAQA
jgi:ribosomal-protein-alanine N-acetyltransferase